MEAKKAAVEGIVDPGDEGGFVGAEIEGKSGDFFRLGHAADGLRARQFLEHLFFAPGIVACQVTIHKRSVHASGRDAIAADIVSEIIAGDGIGHSDDGALAGGIGEAICQADAAGNRGDIEDHAATGALHRRDAGEHAVIETLHIDAKDAIEILLGCVFEFADVRDAGVVDENVDAAFAGQLLKDREDALHLRNVASVGGRAAVADFARGLLGFRGIHVEDADDSAARGKALGNREADATGGAGNDGNFAGE